MILTSRRRGPNHNLDFVLDLSELDETYIEAISAIETMTKPIPIAVPRKTKMAPPVPPFVKGIASVLNG